MIHPTMNAKVVKGAVHRGPRGGYAIVADDYPVFAFGKSIALAQTRFVHACHAYFTGSRGVYGLRGSDIAVGSTSAIEQPIYGASFAA